MGVLGRKGFEDETWGGVEEHTACPGVRHPDRVNVRVPVPTRARFPKGGAVAQPEQRCAARKRFTIEQATAAFGIEE